MRRGRVGATEIARTVNARPSKLRGLTSRDLTTWHQVKQRCSIFMLHGISGLN